MAKVDALANQVGIGIRGDDAQFHGRMACPKRAMRGSSHQVAVAVETASVTCSPPAIARTSQGLVDERQTQAGLFERELAPPWCTPLVAALEQGHAS